jgi:hypothetical protein
MVKAPASVAVPPSVVCTRRSKAPPVIPAGTVNVPVIVVLVAEVMVPFSVSLVYSFTKLTLVYPLTVWKLLPFRVNGTVMFLKPFAGVNDRIVGAGTCCTVNAFVLATFPPSNVVTLTFHAPTGALYGMVMFP